MTPFLKNLANHLLNTYRDKISNLCIVFPSRRAGIYFRKHLSSLLTKPFWSPTIYSIEEFIQANTKYIIAEDLVLRFELYNVFKNHGESESFDKFYPWGGMLLKDFDEIDKNLVSANEIFRVIKEFKDIEKSFSLPLEELEQFKAFWKTFSERKLTHSEEEFLKIWDLLEHIYIDFKSNLEKQNIAYEGMAIRKLVDDIENEKIVFDQFERIIFSGFNSLSKSEEKIISSLLSSGKAEIFWDADEYYVNDNLQEAGTFLRHNFKSLNIKSPLWVDNNFINTKNKSINIVGAALNVGQAKALGDKLSDIIKTGSMSLENTAVILPDESLLMPVLYSIPAEVKKMNVTMGFPFRSTSLYNFFELLKNLQLNKKRSGKNFVFYHKDVTEILMHPYVKFINPGYIYNIVNYIKRYSIIYITAKKIIEFDDNSPELLSLIFKAPGTEEENFDYLYKILDIISFKTENTDESYAKFELEYFYSVYEQLNCFRDIISQYKESVAEQVFWHIIIECLKNIRIPFTGEPLEGLQIMGLLESRSLDFNNVFILSMNEGILPKGNTHSSFIPYNLRRVFKLPTFEDDDSNSAYNFYRLLQKAENVYLFYNTENDNIYSGEKSRFLLQLENELQGKPNIDVNSFIIQASIDQLKKHEITIPKTNSIIERLNNEAHYSASDIIDYIACELKFYFKKLAKLEEEEAVEEYFSPSTFGKIFHSVMQILYKDYIGKVLNDKVIESIKENIKNNYDSIIAQAFRSINELKEMSPNPQGKNLLLKNVIRKLTEKVLDNELEETPFTLIDLETNVNRILKFKFNSKEYNINLIGRIDRIDEKDGVKRILDYKTGNVDISGKNMDDEAMMNEIFINPDFKENFQAAFYGYLYISMNNEKNVELGIYPVKKLDEGIAFIQNIDLSPDGIEKFENKLKELFSNLYNPDNPFQQTTDTDRCKYCPYISICYRE